MQFQKRKRNKTDIAKCPAGKKEEKKKGANELFRHRENIPARESRQTGVIEKCCKQVREMRGQPRVRVHRHRHLHTREPPECLPVSFIYKRREAGSKISSYIDLGETPRAGARGPPPESPRVYLALYTHFPGGEQPRTLLRPPTRQLSSDITE